MDEYAEYKICVKINNQNLRWVSWCWPLSQV